MCKWLLMVLLFVLLFPTVAHSQSQSLNIDMGGYYTPRGAHPHVGFLLRGGLDVEYPKVGLRSMEIEHAAIASTSTVSDLYLAVRTGVWIPFYRTDATYVYGLALAGVHRYRLWICEDQSCQDPEGPGQKFDYQDGLGTVFGIGIVYKTARFDIRYVKNWFDSITDKDFTATLGVVLFRR